ncbi:hypothetical protein, partial [Saezia sanguinis]|uniref:hypothetical protein n=1 Tax=Saezia sanguinis TaxID=1965230 RepID=UPI0011D03ED1
MDIENLDPATARRISREVGREIFDTYGFEVLGFEKLAVPVALAIRNAIIDHFDEVLQLYTLGIGVD